MIILDREIVLHGLNFIFFCGCNTRHNSWQGVGEAEEFQAFFDCYETQEEMAQRGSHGSDGPHAAHAPRRYPLERRGSGECHRSLGLVPEANNYMTCENLGVPDLLCELMSLDI